MIKNYVLKNGSEFKTITIPKGTVLFRGITIEDNNSHLHLFKDMLGQSKKEGVFEYAPTMNVFFFPAPYVSQCVNDYSVHIMYITNYDIELLLLLKPSETSRNIRHEPYKPDISLVSTCSSISKEDKCGFKMTNYDPCFTDKLLNEFPNILGYITLAEADVGQFKLQIEALRNQKSYNTIVQMLPCISSDSRELQGIPEIVLFPLHNRENKCARIYDRDMYTVENAAAYLIRRRALFNYFPFLYITPTSVYHLENIDFEKMKQEAIHYNFPKQLQNDKIFNKFNDIMNELLSPEGYQGIQMTIDMRTGFYKIKTANQKIKYNERVSI